MIQAYISFRLHIFIYFCSYHLKILNGKIITEDTNVDWEWSTKKKLLWDKTADYLLHSPFLGGELLLPFLQWLTMPVKILKDHADPLRKWEGCQKTDRMASHIYKVVDKWLPQQSFPLQLSYLWPRIHWAPRNSNWKFIPIFMKRWG